MTGYRVRIVREAEEDLAELVKYIANQDSVDRADYVLKRLRDVYELLEQHPARGHFLSELLALGIKSYREVHFKPYRIIYEIIGRDVFIMLIMDAQRSVDR